MWWCSCTLATHKGASPSFHTLRKKKMLQQEFQSSSMSSLTWVKELLCIILYGLLDLSMGCSMGLGQLWICARGLTNWLSAFFFLFCFFFFQNLCPLPFYINFSSSFALHCMLKLFPGKCFSVQWERQSFVDQRTCNLSLRGDAELDAAQKASTSHRIISA